MTSGESENVISCAIAVERAFKVMVTTDTPLYQPGQVIHIRTLSLGTADLRPVAGRDIIIEVRDPRGNKVFKKRATTSSFGIAAADLELADQVNTGRYVVSAVVEDTRSERSVTVERYRLPKFRIELATDRTWYGPGEKVVCDLEARYTFGKPVSGASVRAVATESVEEPRPLATADGVLDAVGRFTFEIPLKESFAGQELRKGDAFVTIEATVTDTGGHAQTKTLDLTVTARPIRVELFPESGALVRNVDNVLYIVTPQPSARTRW